MARPVDCDLDPELQNVSLDTLFLIVLQATVVIALGKFIHLSLRRHNQPSAISQILVRMHATIIPFPLPTSEKFLTD
jgi:hypothetical protein